MPLVKGGRIVADDFERIEDGAPVPPMGRVLVSAARFLADQDEFAARDGATGVIWPNDKNVADLAPYLDKLALVALVFPAFKDGRAYSQARLLRERYGYRGELRATGQVLRDQFVFLLRAGFDSFDVVKPADAAAFEEAAKRYTVFFQPTGDGRMTVARARVGKGKPAMSPVSTARAPV
ncbi:MAG: DUF934 domain-containing protein [Xanthobacteraceae bacterium]